MPSARILTPAGCTIVAGLTLAFGAAPAATSGASAERTIYVSIVGTQGPVVTGVEPADLQVVEDTVEREVVRVEPAADPVSVALLLDTTRHAQDVIGDLRQAARDLSDTLFRLSPDSRLAIAEFGGRALITQPFTSSPEDVQQMIPTIVANTDGGAVMLEGLVEVAGALAQEENTRRFIVTVNMEPTDEFSQMRFESVAEAVRAAGATVYAIQIQESQQRDPGRDQLLQALVTNTGGIRRSITSTSALEGLLGSIASLATTQFAVTFTRPEDAPPANMTQVRVAREGFRAFNLVWSTQ